MYAQYGYVMNIMYISHDKVHNLPLIILLNGKILFWIRGGGGASNMGCVTKTESSILSFGKKSDEEVMTKMKNIY